MNEFRGILLCLFCWYNYVTYKLTEGVGEMGDGVGQGEVEGGKNPS